MKDDILKRLYKNRDLIDDIIKSFESEDIKNRKPEIVFSLFDLVENVCDVELRIYNYLKEI